MPRSWIPLAATLAIQAMVALALLALPVMAPVIAQDLGIPPQWVGLYVALAYAGAMLASLAAGAAVGKYGAIRASQGALVLCAAGLLLSTSGSVAAVALGALLIGIGYGPVTPASSHLLARTTPPDRLAVVFSIKQTGVPLGGMIAGAALPSLLLLVGWRWTLCLVAVTALICAVLAQPLRVALDEGRDPHRRLSFGNLAQPLKLIASHRGLAMLAACSFVFSIAQLCLMTYMVIFLNQELGYSLVTAGLALSVAQLGGIVGRVAWGWLADRFLGARRTLALLAALMTASCLATAAIGPGTPAWLLGVVLAVFGASAIGWNGVYLAEVARQAPEGLASVATGGTLAVTFSGVVVGPPLFAGIVALSDSYRVGYAVLAIPTLLCCLALVWARRRTVS